MIKKLIYSKHSAKDRCGLAYFADHLSKKLNGKHITNFHGFSACEELFINLDIYELDEAEVSNLLRFISSGYAAKSILLMHDYRFSYLEDELIKKCDAIVNLSGEEALNKIASNKVIDLFTPSLIEAPAMKFSKKSKSLSLAFGFFNPRKKAFHLYIKFYEYMVNNYSDWKHIIVASSHIGQDGGDIEYLHKVFDDESILVLDFLPSNMISELISASDLGVCFYPTGIMRNNAAPMSFFAQGKPVITTYGDLAPKEFKSFTINWNDNVKFDFSKTKNLTTIGKHAQKFYEKNLNWDLFIDLLYKHINKLI